MDPDRGSPPEPGAPDSPLSDDQIKELAYATVRAGKILRAGRVAAFTGWTVGVAGALSLLLGMFSPTGFLTGAALLAVAWNELEGRKMLLRFHPGGARRLARNQLWLLAVIAAYCGWAIFQAHFRPNPELSQLESVLELDAGFMAEATTAVYLIILLSAVVFQWGMYRYHTSRIPIVGEFVAKTPHWVLEVQRIVRAGGAAGNKGAGETQSP